MICLFVEFFLARF